MDQKKIKVFLTGATGVMGMAGLKEFTNYPEKYEITILARESHTNRSKLQPYLEKGIKVVWGDLLDESSLRKGIEGRDIVLHVGGMVSPKADHFPEKTMEVNVGSMKLISRIVKEIEDADEERTIKVVYIGSVAQYGSKLPPDHWGNVNDPQVPSKFDKYGESKVLAEKELMESGVKKWVSIRQTAILHPGLLTKASDPVVFHTPLKGVLEWITTEDSGRLLERVCRRDVPDDFWCKCYNAGGGEPFRLTNIEFERGLLKAMGCPKPEKIFEPHWFAADNFHGMWFEDSDDLDDILHFREKDTYENALKRIKKKLPFYFKFTPLVPSFIIKAYMKTVASKKVLGPLSWIKGGDDARVEAAWGSWDNYYKIPGWEEFEDIKLTRTTPRKLKNN